MIWAAAVFSTSLSALCLYAALTGDRFGPWVGAMAAVIAAAALARSACNGRRQNAALIVSEGGVRRDSPGPGVAEAVYWPISVTAGLICLVRADRTGDCLSVWRDGIAPDGFRRMAAYGLWRRNGAPNRSDSLELIGRNAVTCTRMAPRAGWPRAE